MLCYRLMSCFNNIPSFLQRTTLIACSFSEGCILHCLHILGIAPFYCDRRAWAASMQSYKLWQQATVQFTPCSLLISATQHSLFVSVGITHHAHSILACLHHIHIRATLSAHPIHGASCMWRCANQEASIPQWSGNVYNVCSILHNLPVAFIHKHPSIMQTGKTTYNLLHRQHVQKHFCNQLKWLFQVNTLDKIFDY